MKNETLTPMAFEFSATSQEVRSLIIGNDPWFVAKDVCDILEIQRTNDALQKLDEDEKLMRIISASGQNRKMWCVNESGLYALIMRSNKPEAKSFRKWVTSEVLPALRKHGHYGQRNENRDFLDARDVPIKRIELDRNPIRVVDTEEGRYYNLVDVMHAIGSKTSAFQTAKRLNLKQELARKIWLFGDTNPGWYTTELGVRLVCSGSRIMKSVKAIPLNLNKGGDDE